MANIRLTEGANSRSLAEVGTTYLGCRIWSETPELIHRAFVGFRASCEWPNGFAVREQQTREEAREREGAFQSRSLHS
jgi:hypothetical protein